MPNVYQQDIDSYTKLGLWHITENEAFFNKQIRVQNQISHPHKRLQHFAGRFLLQYLAPELAVNEIEITALGKPFIKTGDYQFSISHCGDFAAVIVARQGRVGIDIEIPKPSILKVQEKFLKPTEVEILRGTGFDDIESFTIGWNIKESMFKWYGLGQVDFKEDMQIRELHHNPLRVKCIFRKDLDFHATLHVLKIEDVLLSYVVTDY